MFPHIEKKGEGKSGKDELGPSLRSKSNSGGREQSFRPYIHQRKYLQIKLWNMSTNVPVKLKCLNISDFVTSAYSINCCHQMDSINALCAAQPPRAIDNL